MIQFTKDQSSKKNKNSHSKSQEIKIDQVENKVETKNSSNVDLSKLKNQTNQNVIIQKRVKVKSKSKIISESNQKSSNNQEANLMLSQSNNSSTTSGMQTDDFSEGSGSDSEINEQEVDKCTSIDDI